MSWSSIFSSIGSGIKSAVSSDNFWGDMLKGVIGGAASYASAKSSAKAQLDLAGLTAQERRKLLEFQYAEDRKDSLYEQQLAEYAADNAAYKKGIALDTYGAFNTMKQMFPNYTPTAARQKPVAPTAPAVS